MHTYTIIYKWTRRTACHAGQQRCSPHTATQDSDNNKVWHKEVGSQKQKAPSVANSPIWSGVNLASTHQMAPPSTHLIKALLLIYRPRKDETLKIKTIEHSNASPVCHNAVWCAEVLREQVPHNAFQALPGAESDASPAVQTTLPAQTVLALDPAHNTDYHRHHRRWHVVHQLQNIHNNSTLQNQHQNKDISLKVWLKKQDEEQLSFNVGKLYENDMYAKFNSQSWLGMLIFGKFEYLSRAEVASSAIVQTSTVSVYTARPSSAKCLLRGGTLNSTHSCIGWRCVLVLVKRGFQP